MQSTVQDRILRAVAEGGFRQDAVLAECPGADERDVRRAVKLLFAADAISGSSPLVLTAEGRRRLDLAA